MKSEPNNFTYSLQEDDFSLAEEYQKLRHTCPSSGAIVTFTGLVRDFSKNGMPVDAIELSVYLSMTQKQLEAIGQDVIHRFNIDSLCIIHRFGKLKPQEQIVYVGVASQHRPDAFAAAEMSMDFLKSRVAFWKKEQYTNNKRHQWIEPSASDIDAVNRWDK